MRAPVGDWVYVGHVLICTGLVLGSTPTKFARAPALSGRLAEHRNPLLAKKEAELSLKLLNRLLQSDDLPSIKPSPSPPYSLGDQVRETVTMVIQKSFWRALPKPEMQFRYESKNGPWFDVEVKGQLGIAYLTLLRTFARGWKRCKRPDCGNLFRATDDARKIFCSQYCGHLESMRKKRRETKHKRTLKVRGR